MKIFQVKHLAEADRVTIKNEGITSAQLMERASTAVYNEIHKRLNHEQIPIKIFCGIGNNGGDGLVVGRLLLEQGYNVTIFIVNFTKERTPDFLLNYNKVKDMGEPWPTLLMREEDFPALSSKDFVIDAIFGIIPILFIMFDWVNVIYPSIISISLSIISLAGIFIFQGKCFSLSSRTLVTIPQVICYL